MTLSPLDLVVHWAVFTINYIYTPCREKNGTTIFLRITFQMMVNFQNLSLADLAVNF